MRAAPRYARTEFSFECLRKAVTHVLGVCVWLRERMYAAHATRSTISRLTQWGATLVIQLREREGEREMRGLS